MKSRSMIAGALVALVIVGGSWCITPAVTPPAAAHPHR
jgi:hypothetical protein